MSPVQSYPSLVSIRSHARAHLNTTKPRPGDTSRSVEFVQHRKAMHPPEVGIGAANMPDVQPSALGAVATTADTSVTETQTSAPPRHQRLSPPAGPREHFDIKGKWQGHVVSVGEETFTAIIKDVLGQSSDEEVEIYLEEISQDDRPLVVPGAHFYWAIGYRDVIGGYRMRASIIKMQRLPGWTADDLREARGWATRIQQLVEDA